MRGPFGRDKRSLMSSSSRKDTAVGVLRLEASHLDALAAAFDEDKSRIEALNSAIDLILGVKSHVIVVGVGKSGQIGQKIAASFASTGTPAFFMHPTEASHGDLGMVTADCLVLAISNSGESREMGDVLTYCRSLAVPVISITQNARSTLGQNSDVVLELTPCEEAGLNGLAPTSSTTQCLALGDALVVATMSEKRVSELDFARRHPGGKLGRGLQTVANWMALHPSEPPIIEQAADMSEVVSTMTSGQEGCVAVVDENKLMVGIITDGDLRRNLSPDMFKKTAGDIMTRDPLSFTPNSIMRDVVKTLTDRRMSNAFVLDAGRPVAVLHMKSLTTQGYV